MFAAGDQLPVIPLFEVVGKTSSAPEQIGASCVKVDVTLLVTVTVIVAVVPHWPVAGVNVYVLVDKLVNAGDQVPVMPFVEVVGNE